MATACDSTFEEMLSESSSESYDSSDMEDEVYTYNYRRMLLLSQCTVCS